ncbi:MAG: non-heme iron oxygenase ferredoxin subunit [Planctomycetaceae bacterium]|nr:non-heme iron oxygenase ferredoxin subunit [Planctomycetaceae bacterium]
MAQWERVADRQELIDGGRKSVVVDETPALLLHLARSYFCIEDVCTHDGQPLTDGPVSEGQITCPRHGARFDVRTGAATCMPATEPIRTFAVEERDDGIYARAD